MQMKITIISPISYVKEDLEDLEFSLVRLRHAFVVEYVAYFECGSIAIRQSKDLIEEM